ncbi:MAG: hypothetical protein IKE01_06055 [Clostridia bacterium]|nr:hypothetical protein [Clostridia bacterium]
MKKKGLFIIFTILIIIIILIFVKNNYKNFKIGNNENNKSVKQIEEYILNIKSYTAKLDVNIKSNKNENKYVLRQEYVADENKRQIVEKPENIEGTEILYKNGNLEINNSKLNLSKMYSSYPYLSDNVLWLSSFLDYYKNGSIKKSIYEENEYVVMQIDESLNEYFKIWKLYLEKGTGKPRKMVVQDNNKNDIIYILYTEINFK